MAVRRSIIGVVLLATVLPSACGRAGPGAGRGPAGAKLNAGGEAPLWALQIRPKTLSFSSEQVASITLPNPGATAAAHGKVWSGAALGRPFRAILTAAPAATERPA